MNGWKQYSVRDLIDRGYLFVGDGYRAKNSELSPNGIPFARAGNINNGFQFEEDTDCFPLEDLSKVGNKVSQPFDIVFTSKGTVGRFAYVRQKTPRFVYSPQLCFWRCLNDSVIDSRFLYFWINGREFWEQVHAVKDQTDMADYVSLFDQRSMTITLPSLPEQEAIAGVLSSLDDKIDLLHRQNKTLEGMAEALWRKMFVDEADPGWDKGTLSDYGRIVCGKTPSKKQPEYFGGGTPLIKIPDMHGNVFVFQAEDSLSKAGEQSQHNKTLPPRSVCVSCIATIGLVSMNAYESQTNQQINSIVPAFYFQRYFVFLLLRSMTDDLYARASGGTATDNLNTGDFSRIEASIPPESKLKVFDESVSHSFDRIFANSIQIHTLSCLRDTLLRKLMSGEVRVAQEKTA